MTKRCLVLGGHGFIGGHLVKRLKSEGHFVRVIDIKDPEFEDSQADEFLTWDLRYRPDFTIWHGEYDEVYQLAADMGGAGHVFSGLHDADILTNSSLINLNVLQNLDPDYVGRVFFSSSACVYKEMRDPEDNSLLPCVERYVYPANPDSDYGFEKLFSERLYQSYARNKNMTVRIARLHNIFGPFGTWRGGREKSPAAICRKVAEAENVSSIEVWGDGEQTRSFLYIDECIDGITRLTRSDFEGPVNIGSSEMVTINQLVGMVAGVAGKTITIEHVEGPLGVRGRNSDNDLIGQKLGWRPCYPLHVGLEKTYAWIAEQVRLTRSKVTV